MGTRSGVRILKALLWIPLGLAFLLVLAVLLFQSTGIREFILQKALSTVSNTVPGTIEGDVRWPRTNQLVLNEASWVDEGDSLAAARRISVEWNWRSLLNRDVVLNQCVLQQVHVNLPSVSTRFASAADTTTQQATVSEPFFPRPGSIEGLPSAAIEAFVLEDIHVVLPDSSEIFASGRGRAQGLAGGIPELLLELETSLPDQALNAEVGTLSLTGNPPRISGELQIVNQEHGAAQLRFEPAGSDGTRIRCDIHGGQSFSVLDLVWTPTSLLEWDIEGTMSVPSTQELKLLPLFEEPLRPFGDLEGLILDTKLTLNPARDLQLRLQGRETHWMQEFLVAGRWQGGTWSLEEATVRMPDLDLQVEGSSASPEEMALEVRAAVAGSRFLETLLPGTGFILEDADLLLTYHISSNKNGSKMDALLHGHGRINDTKVDSLLIEVNGTDFSEFTWSLYGRALEASAAISGRAGLSDVILLRTGPLRLNSPPAPSPRPERAGSRIHIDPKGRNYSAENFTVTGNLGEIQTSGEIQGGVGKIILNGDWSTLPATPVEACRIQRFGALRLVQGSALSCGRSSRRGPHRWTLCCGRRRASSPRSQEVERRV